MIKLKTQDGNYKIVKALGNIKKPVIYYIGVVKHCLLRLPVTRRYFICIS